MCDLEKIAMLKESENMGAKIWDSLVTGARKIPSLTAGAVVDSLKGGAYVAKKGLDAGKPATDLLVDQATKAAKNPVTLGTKILATSILAPAAYESTNYKNYASKVDNPVKFKANHRFGVVNSRIGQRYTAPIAKTAMRQLEKEAGFMDAMKNTADTLYKTVGTNIPKAVGLLASAAILAPTLKTVGEKLQRRIFNEDDRLNTTDEMAKIKIKSMGQYLADKEIKTYSDMINRKYDIPKVTSIVDSLKRTDPLLMGAYDNEKSRDIMNQTTSAVYAFSPSLAKDRRAMQSILTEAVTSPEGGLSFQTIKSLAETQKFVNQNKG